MKRLLFLCLTISAHAANYSGDVSFTAPFELNEPANIVGNVTLETPGYYAAASWNITGTLRFARPGLYTFQAIQSGIHVGGRVLGPPSGTVGVSAIYISTANFVGVVASSVGILATQFQPPDPIPGGGGPIVSFPGDGSVNPLHLSPVMGASGAAPLVNISTRATLAPGQIITPGFVVGGTTPRRVVIRAVGPTLQDFGVAEPMAAPMLTVFSGTTVLATNSAWGGNSILGGLFTNIGAFALPALSRDAAVVLRLDPGSYTVQVRGTTGGGEVLVELYFVD